MDEALVGVLPGGKERSSDAGFVQYIITNQFDLRVLHGVPIEP